MDGRRGSIGERVRTRVREFMVKAYWLLYRREKFRQRSSPQAQIDRPERRASRSVVFINNSYYNFFYLARALRQRGWDAISVSIVDPEGPDKIHFHGADVELYSGNPFKFRRNLVEFASHIVRRFDMVHFYGAGAMSLFPELHHRDGSGPDLPWDFSWFRASGIKIGYSVNGCSDGISQTHLREWTGGLCDRCIWQHRPDVCNDQMNLDWGRRAGAYCDLVCTETHPAIDYQVGSNVFREPMTTALDSDLWTPYLEVPPDRCITRAPGELIVYHGVGNYQARSVNGRNVKGTSAVVAAVEQLRSEGINVKLQFASGMPNRELRYIQAQADVIVDQLGIGRYGAAAREGMMLGKPVICRLVREEEPGVTPLQSLAECPLVSATEETVCDVLRDLLLDEAKRRQVGEASRRYMLKWHSAEACAERFEKSYDRLMGGQSVEWPLREEGMRISTPIAVLE